VAGLTACGGDSDNNPPSDTQPLSVTVWNRSQFELLDVRVHDGTTYASAPNLLSEPLAIEAQRLVQVWPGYHVTVIRRKIEVGDTIALTTSRGLDQGGTLVVFDEAFRLMPGTP
jgi:hypothetical protein